MSRGVYVGQRLHAAACIATVGLLTWALLSPDPYSAVEGGSLGWVGRQSDKFLHSGSFGILSLVLFSFAARVTQGIPVSWVLALSAYAIATEILQSAVPGRNCDLGDVMANLSGIFAGLIITQFSAALLLRSGSRPATSHSG